MKKFEQLNQQEKELKKQKAKKDNSTITISPKTILICMFLLVLLGVGLFFLFRDTSAYKPTVNDILAANSFGGDNQKTYSDSSSESEPERPTENPEYSNAVTSATRLLKSHPMSYATLINELVKRGYETDVATYGADHCNVDWKAIAVRRAKELLNESTYSADEMKTKLSDEEFSPELIDYVLSNSSVTEKLNAGHASPTQEQTDESSYSGSAASQQEIMSQETESIKQTISAETHTYTPAPAITESPSPEPAEQATKVPAEYENAVRSAERLIKTMPISRSTLIEKLTDRGYSLEASTYASDHSGIDWNEQAVKRAQKLLKTKDYTKEELTEQLRLEGFTQEEADHAAENCR